MNSKIQKYKGIKSSSYNEGRNLNVFQKIIFKKHQNRTLKTKYCRRPNILQNRAHGNESQKKKIVFQSF